MLLRNGSGQGTVEMRLHVDLLNEQNWQYTHQTLDVGEIFIENGKQDLSLK